MSLPPAFVMLIGALILPFVSGNARTAVALITSLLTLWTVWSVPDGVSIAVNFLEFELILLKNDALARVFGTIFSITAFVGALFAMKQNSSLELCAAFVYAGGAVGVVMAGDLITVFLFWELMALASTAIIWANRTDKSYRASMRYLLIHLFGGVLLMTGIIGRVIETGTIEFVAMQPDDLSTCLILMGFLINAGAPPLSSWLPDAYPEASWSGMVFLSAFTTKTAVYVLLRGFSGADILIPIGIFMIFYGIIYALLENDMRRILAYSIVNQVGFMVVGAGIGTEMAVNGATAHAFTHIIYKALLLMSAGSVLLMTGGKRRCTDLGGLFKTMPFTMVMGVIGALAISSFPLTSGFISKSMITQGAADKSLVWVYFALAAASAGVFLHAGIKFPWYVFFQKDSGLRPKEPPINMKIAMAFFAFLCIGLGIYPQPLYLILPFEVTYEPYTFSHVITMLQLLLFSGLAFFVMLPYMKRTMTITLDFDWLYRRLFMKWFEDFIMKTGDANKLAKIDVSHRLTQLLVGLKKVYGPDGSLARTRPTGTQALWAAMLLGATLLIYYQ